ncbi:MAG: hypothetical protein IJW30_02430 [Clostridia bacterium]|nr:hypothetical protein [Clostridia bacterium]
MENESCIKDIISDSLNQVRTIMDADTIVGKQIVTPSGTVIIPISKVSMGFASGGLDLPNKKAEGGSIKNFGGGGGTGVTVVPVGFLVVSPNGSVSMLPMTSEKPSPIEKVADILNSAPEMIERVKSALGGVRPAKEKDEEEAAADAEAEKTYNDLIQKDVAAEEAIKSTKWTLDGSDAYLSKEEKKRLKQEAKLFKYADSEDGKHGKLSEKTLESGQIQ